MPIPMLFRFSAYGFLKNQQYYDPFIILCFHDEKGLSFFMIGVLIGFRELMVNLMEVPTGVIADLCGRRGSMILSLSSYIVSFLIFGLSAQSWPLWPLFAAMVFFAIGEAFRTGTHKAMIITWLRLEGRQDQKTKTYGFTRSWSKIGSALAVLIGAGIVLATGRYTSTFLFAIVPYLVGIANFLGYPRELDGETEGRPTVGKVVVELGRAFRQAFFNPRLRRVLLESMGYESTFKVVKGYLQPIIKQVAIALPVLVALEVDKRTAILVSVFFFPLYLVSGYASRKAHAFSKRFGGESRAARMAWLFTLLIFLPIAAALWRGVWWLAATGFVALALLENLWRPITITRVDNETDAKMGATMLSIESQAKAVGAMVLAPLLGLAVDKGLGGALATVGYHLGMVSAKPSTLEVPALWVAGAVGVAIALVGSLIPTMEPAPAEQQVR